MFVKICGITNEEDALLAVAMGADALGFVFASGSRRMVRPELARDIVKRLPGDTVTVGVFRDERPERVVELVNKIGLTGAQLHGREPVSEVRWVRKRVQFVIQAFAAGDPALAAAGNGPADVILVDSPDPGSGRLFDWTLAEGAPGGIRLLVAGGLTSENVGDAIQRLRPWGVDVSSGVESSPGRKDARKLRRLVQAARAAAEALESDERPPAAAESPYDWEFDELAGS
ncbi:MAG: phosphoribosylanthranilate isomerase [Actinobacteria bacterium]|nr:phosphoribosylanthranilate isomerase [Actinomycetota bacterium]